MHLLFSEAGNQRMDDIVQAGMLCAFDFDGTLAPIVQQPDKVQMPYELQQQLITLSRYASIAIITGRSIQDLQKHLGFVPDFIIGNHGLEGLPGWEQHADRYRNICSRWQQRLAPALQEPIVSDAGIWIENKQYSLSVHCQPTRDIGNIEETLNNAFSQLTPAPHVIAGKKVFNLLPPGASDKGIALAQLMASNHFRHAIYVGDDVTDEDVFRLRRHDVLGVKIGNATNSAADFFLQKQQDIRHLLDELIVRLRFHRKSHFESESRLAS